MPHSDILTKAYFVNGPRKVKVAKALDISTQHLGQYFLNKARVPLHKRQAFDRALSSDFAPVRVDWHAYDAEFDAANGKTDATGAPETPPEPVSRPKPLENPLERPHTLSNPPKSEDRGILGELFEFFADEEE
ncbi:MAG: hypothetical protein AAF429_14500 [Pseudomonadota bacterium]